MTDDAPTRAQNEKARALVNAVKLSLSLGATLVVTIAVRFWLPRELGPVLFGQLHFSESLAIAAFLFTALGVDMYIRKEVATRPEHASEFLGGLLLLRAFISVLAFGGIALTLSLMNKGALEWRLAMLFGVGQIGFVLQQTLSSLLHATGNVNELSFVNPIGKLVWGVGIVAGIGLGMGVEIVAAAFIVTEWGKSIVLVQVVRRYLPLTLRLDWTSAKHVLIVSTPFFLNFLAHRIYERIDVQMISVLVDDREVGLYGGAVNLATAGVLLMPVVSAVILPMGARIARESPDELDEVMKAQVRLVTTGGALFSVMLVLHAPELIALLFGPEYEHSLLALRILAPMFPLTYIATLGSMHLVQLDRIWSVAKISMLGLSMNPLTNLWTIPWGAERLGAGGGGAGAAITSVLIELVAATAMLIALGRSGFDRRLVYTLLKCGALCLLLWGIHVVSAPLLLWRAPLQVLAFGLAGWAIGVIPVRALLDTARSVLHRRK